MSEYALFYLYTVLLSLKAGLIVIAVFGPIAVIVAWVLITHTGEDADADDDNWSQEKVRRRQKKVVVTYLWLLAAALVVGAIVPSKDDLIFIAGAGTAVSVVQDNSEQLKNLPPVMLGALTRLLEEQSKDETDAE